MFQFFLTWLILFTGLIGGIQGSQNEINLSAPDVRLIKRIKATPGLVALWKFSEKAGKEREAVGLGKFPVREAAGKVMRVDEGPVSGYSVLLDGSNYLSLPHEQAKQLNIFGGQAEITIIAWVKWTGEQTGFVAGMWNEYQDGGRRQYGLFVSLPYYNGEDQVCGHISASGKPTPPFPYSADYSASRQKVPENEWCSIAFTYDGRYIRSYLDGVFGERAPELIQHTKGFEGCPDGLVRSKNPYYFPFGMGNNGSDFTIGAVLLKGGMGNFFKGLIGGVAVYNRALTEPEIKILCQKKDQ